MPPLMILNPRKAKKRRRKASGARRPMTAKQLRFFGPRKAKKKRAPSKSKVIVVNANPRKGSTVAKAKRRHRRRKAKSFLSNPKRRHFRRNPRTPGAGFISNTLGPAAIGALGAIGVDMLLGNMPIPYQMRQGPMLPLLKIGLALLIGAGVGAVSNKEAGEEAAAGGVIVTLYGIGRNFMHLRMPGMQMNRYVAMNGNGRRLMRPGGGGMKRYVAMNGMRGLARMPGTGNMPPGMRNAGLGYFSPARTSNAPSRSQARFLSTQ